MEKWVFKGGWHGLLLCSEFRFEETCLLLCVFLLVVRRERNVGLLTGVGEGFDEDVDIGRTAAADPSRTID